jgi:hypothetical protein
MATETKTGFLGIATNTADLQAPPGALEKAKNVVIRRAGACEPRPGLKPDATRSNTQRTIRIIPYELETVLANNNSEWWNGLGNVAIQYPPPDGGAAVSPATFRNDLIPYAQSRGNLYVGTGIGVVKFDGVPDSITGVDMFITTGVPVVFYADAIIGGTPGFLAVGNQVGYSIVGVKTDANGLIVRSRPTGVIYAANPAGVTRTVTLTIRTRVHPSRLYDKFEIYRTRQFPTSVTPDAEMQLVGEVVPTSTATTFSDNTADGNRGATLYTSPSRDGAEGANDRPPACGAMAVFKNALFCGNTVGPWRLIESFLWGADKSTSATGIGTRTYVGTYLFGGNTITGMASTVGLQKGMVVPVEFGGGYITNISGTTITMSTTALSAGTNPITFHDAITVDNGTTWQSVSGLITAGSVPVGNTIVSYSIVPPIGGYTSTFVIESIMPGATSALQVKATHGDEWVSALPLYDATAATGTRDTNLNGLRWSKPDEPEHFPPSNYALVGDKKRAILGLVATRDALFIFKEDGIWRLTGTNGQYRIDPFDLTTRCVLPSSIVPLKNRIFMLSNRGVVAVSDEGVEVVSMAIDDQLKKLIYTLDVAGAGSGYFLTNVGYAGAACERDNEYMLLVGNAMLAERSNIGNGALVYNDVTRAWTSWEFSNSGSMALTPYTWSFHDRYGVIKLAQRVLLTSYLYFAEPGATFTNSQTWRCDNTASLTVSGAVVGNVINYTPSNTLVAGDVLYNVTTGASAVVLSSSLGTQATVDNATGFADTNVLTAIRPVACNVAPRAFTEQNLRIKQWVGINAEFSLLAGACTASFSALASVMTNTSTKVVTPFDIKRVAAETRYLTGASIRGVFPVQAARGYRMQAEVAWSHGWGDSTLEAIFVETTDGKANAPNLAVSQ